MFLYHSGEGQWREMQLWRELWTWIALASPNMDSKTTPGQVGSGLLFGSYGHRKLDQAGERVRRASWARMEWSVTISSSSWSSSARSVIVENAGWSTGEAVLSSAAWRSKAEAEWHGSCTCSTKSCAALNLSARASCKPTSCAEASTTLLEWIRKVDCIVPSLRISTNTLRD